MIRNPFENDPAPSDRPRFQPSIGDWVQVRSASQLERILSEDGSTEGLPMMTEMLAHCGKRFQVRKWATNACVPRILRDESDESQPIGEGTYVAFGTLSQCVILDVDRCDGSGHGGCAMACAPIWKTQWLAPDGEIFSAEDSDALQRLRERLTLAATDDSQSGLPIYRCQATQLSRIVGPISRMNPKRWKTERQLNQVSATALVTDMCSSLMVRARGQKGGISGPCVRTPVADLGLAIGDQVRVKSLEEITQTLDRSGKNRGLWFDPLMLRHCGETLTVSRRVTKFISESTGRMIETSVPSIVLDDLHCDGRARRYCSRLLHFFWRECWLERVGSH